MDHSVALARHLARLVWLFLNDTAAYDVQLAALQLLVDASHHGGVTLTTRDWRLVANGTLLPEDVSGAQDLTAQLIGHSIVELTVDQDASPADLLLLARVLASEPVPGDGGRNLLARLKALDAQAVHALVEAPQTPVHGAAIANSSLSAKMPGMIPDTSIFSRGGDGPPLGRSGDETGPEDDVNDGEDDGAIVHERDPEEMFRAFSTTTTPKGSMVKLFEHLDGARGPTTATRQLDALVKLAAESARKERHDIVADVVYGVVKREPEIEDRTIRRQFGMAIRRLCTPSVLKCVVELLPRRRENYEQYMAVFVRAEDAGAEALVDALIAAPSITDRRVYYDALLRLRTGIRALLHMLGDPRWYVVRNAVELLGELRVAEADAELTKLLEHRDDRVRTAAASALAKLGSVSAAKGVRGILREAPAELRERAAEALALNRNGSVDSLIRAFDREEDPRVQMAILTALGQIGSPQAVEKLVEIARTEKGILFKARPTPVRVAAVHALGEVQSSAAIAALQTLLRDKEKAVRGAASWVMMGKKRKKSERERAGE
jgi:HEAT repeat protein